MVRYMGIFFEGEQAELIKSMQPTKLEKTNDEIHCTFKYLPKNEELIDDIVGQEVEVFLIGYGCDGNNSGFEIAFDDVYDSYYINYDESKTDENGKPILKTKHITVSLKNNASAVNTKNLEFVRLAEPISVTGRFGYWLRDDKDVEYISYDKVLEENIILK